MVWINPGRGNLTLISNNTFNDGEFHVLSLIKNIRKIELRVDDEVEALGTLPSTTPTGIDMPGEEGGLYFGGIPEIPDYDDIVPTSIRFNGTITDVVFNNRTISFHQTLNFTKVKLGRFGPQMGSLNDYKRRGRIGNFKETPEGCQRVS